jgi:hypothetical protein
MLPFTYLIYAYEKNIVQDIGILSGERMKKELHPLGDKCEEIY